MEHNGKDIQKEMEQAAAKLDAIEAATPDFNYFKHLVDGQQAKLKRAQRIQLALFVLVAVVLVSAVILLTGRFQMFFLLLQGAAVAGAVAGLAVFFIRTRRLSQGAR